MDIKEIEKRADHLLDPPDPEPDPEVKRKADEDRMEMRLAALQRMYED